MSSDHVCTSWGWVGQDDDQGLQIMRCLGCGRLRSLGALKLTDCVTSREHDIWYDASYWGERHAESEAEFKYEDEIDELKSLLADRRPPPPEVTKETIAALVRQFHDEDHDVTPDGFCDECDCYETGLIQMRDIMQLQVDRLRGRSS